MGKIETVLITQARTGSTRLPGKVLLKVNGEELLKIHLKRLQKCTKVNQIIVATTTNESDNVIVDLCNTWGFDNYRGSEDDVLDRFYQTVKSIAPTWVVRVTSDCPLIDPTFVDAVISFAQVNGVDYASNGIVENFPDGQDIEVFKFSALEKAWKNAALKSEREHVTPYIRTHSNIFNEDTFLAINFPSAKDYSKVRMTVDELRDFYLIEKLVNDLGVNENWLTYTEYIIKNDLIKINDNIIRNEGLLKSLKSDQNG
jgi:spore coat polysaccharide biosynthesis protein SpsF